MKGVTLLNLNWALAKWSKAGIRVSWECVLVRSGSWRFHQNLAMALKDHRPLFRVCYFDIFCSLSYEQMVAIPIVTFCLLNINSAWVIITLLCTATTSSGLMPLCYWHCQLNVFLQSFNAVKEGGRVPSVSCQVCVHYSISDPSHLSFCLQVVRLSYLTPSLLLSMGSHPANLMRTVSFR